MMQFKDACEQIQNVFPVIAETLQEELRKTIMLDETDVLTARTQHKYLNYIITRIKNECTKEIYNEY